jgi:CheY-like chemotaxis protein
MKAEDELREADRRKDEFLAMLAHELRNPLAPISTAAQVLKFPNLDPQRLRTTSDIISRQVAHMTDLIDDLIDVSRVTRGLIELDKSNVEVSAIVAAAVEQARPLIERRGQELLTRIECAGALVRGDRTRLVQVLSNLLNNAAKYTPQGGRVELSVQASAAEVRIEVRDNGIGIDADLLPRLFDLFTQGQRTSDRSQGGLGLGLALARTLVTLHGGSVRAASAGAQQGSSFVVTLPLIDPVNTAQGAPARSAARGARAVDIMVVDDNRDAAESLAALLEACGHKVRIANDGNEALRQAASNPPEVFIHDIGLPGMNGYDLARHLRKLPGAARSLLIALTGYSQAHDRVLSKAAGFAHHFVKPIDMGELAKILAQPAL